MFARVKHSSLLYQMWSELKRHSHPILIFEEAARVEHLNVLLSLARKD
jgi:hypothetical protein